MIAYLSLGSNLNNREGYLGAGIAGLRKRCLKLNRAASLYQTQPKDVIDQPWFLNTVVELDTVLDPESLLDICLQVERENHRVRDRSRGPRTLDIDIILYGDLVLNTETLVIPHPRFAERRFVLEPLAEIAGDFVDPVRGMTILDLLAASTDPAVVERVAPPLF
jgi:2-amino-4-hydroxy-6-hydroxymethyldihydropteridine diphosphokinase